MSDNRFNYYDAMCIAHEILTLLKPCCARLAIAGSLRRKKHQVGDIEILFVPLMSKRPDGLFEMKDVSVADEVINSLLADGYFKKRPSKDGRFSWGELNKLAIHSRTGIPVDLFATTEEKWWVSLVIRTGSKDTNILLTTGANKRGGNLNAYGYGVTWRDGTTTPATSEEHVFELCGVPYKQPCDR